MLRSLALAPPIAALTLLLATSAAHAATFQVAGGEARFTAAPGEVNDVTMPVPLTLTDAGAPVTAGPGCTQVDAHTVRCSEDSPGQLPLTVSTGDRNDRVQLTDTCCRQLTVLGGRGRDALSVNSGDGVPADLHGGPGDDDLSTNEQLGSQSVLHGDSGDDTLTMCCDTNVGGQEFGGDGNDRLIYRGSSLAAFPLVLDGGDGNDTYEFGSQVFASAMVPGPGFDTLDASTGSGPFTFAFATCPGCVERVIGSGAADSITGDDRAQAILGGAGDDVLDGGGGPDLISGQGGNDTINARDGAIDLVRCGSGVDSVTADRLDIVSNDCEQLTRTR